MDICILCIRVSVSVHCACLGIMMMAWMHSECALAGVNLSGHGQAGPGFALLRWRELRVCFYTMHSAGAR